VVGNDKSTDTRYYPTTTVTYGGASDLWGTSWTAADINNSGFGVGYIAHADSDGIRTYIEFMRITVYYTPFIDIGLRIYDGATNQAIACDPAGTLTSPLRISKASTTYGIALVDTGDSSASKIRVKTSSATKALRKY